MSRHFPRESVSTLLLIVALTVFLSACGGAAPTIAPPPTSAPAPTTAPATNAPAPTNAPATSVPAPTSAPAATAAPTAAPSTTDANTAKAIADAKAYLAKVCAKPIGGELNMLVWEGYSDPSFADFFSQACGVKINAT